VSPDNTDDIGRVRHVSIMEEEGESFLRVDVKMIDALCVEG
jgi:hypothetical protein